MKLSYLLAAVAASALCLAACDAPKEPEKPAETAAVTPPPAPPPPPPAPTTIPGLSAAYATEAEWVAACKGTTPAIPETVCTCVSKAVVKEVGADALYDWSFKYLVNRDAQERMRAERWFTTNSIDKAKQQKLADATGKCYTN
jgi:hypothetical protein